MVSVEQRDAKAFVRAHHRHCPPPAGWKFGGAIRNGPGDDGVIGVVMVGRPVAKAINQTKVMEVNRLCIREDIADGLQWNACSLAYGWAAREAKRRGAHRIITYTLVTEPGTSLRAAGWIPEARVRGRSWNTPSRPREDRMEIVDKIRWSRTLVRGGPETPLPVDIDSLLEKFRTPRRRAPAAEDAATKKKAPQVTEVTSGAMG
ncbi:hypothetical protein Mpe_B0228 (plasmid) [Methylibium petroleiphilum PM1]|uniref:N-acetyltransferase domain-containing protein n=2 Tax=Methylibium TaxID=316612 RepID=A2SN64_METPP|nr:hypothetical protein Mpe_B0228 [Methylibium petroleiphilum PM1]